MTSIARWHTAVQWAMAVCWLVCSVTAVSAQEGRWEGVKGPGIKGFEAADYVGAVRQFHAALSLADVGSLPTSLMNLAAVYYALGQYIDAAPLYQRALVLQEQILGRDAPQLVPVLEANAAVHRKMHPVQSLLPWSPASQMAARARRIWEREERTLLQDGPWGTFDPRHLFDDGGAGE